jgi:hypothetical protein
MRNRRILGALAASGAAALAAALPVAAGSAHAGPDHSSRGRGPDFVKDYLWSHPATGVTYSGGTRTLEHSGLAHIYAGDAAARFFGVSTSDPRHPDVFGRVQVGVVYTGGSKIAEHGGDNPGDTSVPLVVYAPGTVEPSLHGSAVKTTQVVPTVLHLLGLDPEALKAVRIEGTEVLPGLGGRDEG